MSRSKSKTPAENTSELARESAGDVLVAIGGGAAIGLAKAVVRRLALPIVAVPTTAMRCLVHWPP